MPKLEASTAAEAKFAFPMPGVRPRSPRAFLSLPAGLRRAQLLTLLTLHQPADAKEALDQAKMRDYAATLADPFDAGQDPAHITASGLIVDPAGTRVCLVHHRKLAIWLQAGGHCELGDESVLAAAIREAEEETGLSVSQSERVEGPLHLDLHEIPGRPERAEHFHLDIRFLLVADGRPRRIEAEAHDVRWFTFAEAAALTGSHSLQRLLDRAQAVLAR